MSREPTGGNGRNEPPRGPLIVGILGSVRPSNYTQMALRLVQDEVDRTDRFSFQFIDPAILTLPLPGSGGDPTDARAVQEAVSGATGVILATPEYHGSFSSVMKLVIENLGFPSRLSGKPVALLGVAGGSIGAIKSLEQLRGVCSHVGAIVLPGPVSVPNVRSVFDVEGNCLDPEVEDRIRGVGRGMMDFIQRSICPAISLEAMVRKTVPGPR